MMERRFGFREIRPLDGSAGQERFGLIDRAGGGAAAVLALQGRTGRPLPAATLPDVLDRLAAALPACAVQFVLSRRPVEPATLLVPWRAGVEQRLGATAPALRVWHDLQATYFPRLHAAGLANVWAGVAVAAPDAEGLAERVAGLFTALPYDATPLTAQDLGGLLGRLLRPEEPAGAGRPFALGGGRLMDLPGATPRALVIGTTAVSLAPDSLTCYWQITPPFPRVPEGWIRRLLEFPDLLPYAYDVAVHLRPAAATTMRDVLDGRLARLEGELRRRGGVPAGGPGPDASAEAADTWLLELERQEVVVRRATLSEGRDRLREAVVLLALHLPAGAAEIAASARGPAGEPRVAAFSAALAAAELVAHPLQGRALLGRAVRATLPLASAEGLHPFPVSARQAAELAALPVSRPPSGAGPVLGLTPEKTLFRYAADGHRVLAGGGAPSRRGAARQWALQSYLQGADLLIWDPERAWAGWVSALGGQYVQPGGPLPADGLNLLAAPLAALNRPEFFDAWVREIADLFGLILPPLIGQDADAVRSQIGAALLQVAMRSLERSDPAGLGLDALHAELRAGGYEAVAAGIAQIAAGPAGHLFRPAGLAGAPPSLVAIGPAGGLAPRPGARAAQIALRHALWLDSPLFGASRPAGRRLVVLVDGVTTALQHAHLAADLLALAAGAPEPAALWLLPGDAELGPLLAHRVGQALVRPLALTVLFGPAAGARPQAPLLAPAPGLAALVALAGIPAATADRLPLLPSDQALVALAGQAWVLEIVTGDLARDA